MLAHTALMVLALLAAASAAQIPPQEDCQAKFEEMGTNSLLSQFQPCQRGVTEECCERGQSIVGFTESAPLGGCLCHEHIFDELVKGINSNTLARAVGVTGAGVQDALQQCGVPFAYGTGESQCPSFDQEDIGGEGDGDGDGGNDEEFMEEVVMDGEMWDQGARGDSSDKEKEEPSDKESTDYKDDDKEKKEVETSGGKGVDDGKDAKVSSSPSSLPTQRGGNGYRGLFPGLLPRGSGGFLTPDASLPFGLGSNDQDGGDGKKEKASSLPPPTEHKEGKRRRGPFRPDLLPIGSGGIVQAAGYQALDTATRPFQMFQGEGRK